MNIGFIGAGSVAQTYAKFFADQGHKVVLSNRKGKDSLLDLTRSLGPNVRAGTAVEAANQEIVILAVRWEHAKDALAQISDWNGRILVDATNRPPNEESQARSASEIISSYAPGARIIKALNTLVVNWIKEFSDRNPKLVLFLAGDNKEAKQKFSLVLEQSGFVPVDLGGLIEGGRLLDFGAPLSGLHLDLLKQMKK